MRLDLERAQTHYDPTSDVLEIELDPELKRTSTFAYEDLLLVHLAKLASGEITLQGLTVIGYQAIRERLHGMDAGSWERTASEAAGGVEMLLTDDGNTLLIRDATAWELAPARLRVPLSKHLHLIRDPVGEVLGVSIDGSNGFEWSDLTELFDLAFDAIFAPAEGEGRLGELERGTASRWAFERWLAPLLRAPAA